MAATEPLARAKGIISRLRPRKPAAGAGDERRLTQVLLNLVGNAVKFTEKGSVDILADAVDGQFEISVRDTGPGIPRDQNRIFEEFQQVDNSSTRLKGGTGLGLAISKRIVEMHGGTIRRAIRARLRLDIPNHDTNQSRGANEGGMSKRILMIEDTEDNRQILRDLIGRPSTNCSRRPTAPPASPWRTEKPDLILMDIQFPVMDGYEATRRIKADPALRHIPIIAVTSYALSGDEAKAPAAGCDGYVAKPFSPRQLLAKIHEFLP